MATITKLFRNKIALTIGGLVIVVVAGFVYSASKKNPNAGALQVRRGDVVEDVIVTGKTKPAESVELAFDTSGRVAEVAAHIGDHVLSGQVLAVIDQAELHAQLLQDQANVDSEQAKLDQLKRGTRPEEISIQELKVASADAKVRQARKDLIDTLQDSYTRSDDAVRNKIDQILTNPRSADPQFMFLVSNPPLEFSFKQSRVALEGGLTAWQSSLAMTTAASNLAAASDQAEKNLTQVKALLETMSLILNGLTASPAVSQTTLSGWRSDISTARTSINTAIANLSSARDTLRSDQSDFALAQNQLILDRAGSTKEDIEAQEALLRQAEAKVAAAEAGLAKTILRSPINGVVTKQDAKVGQISSPNTPVAAVISESNLEIEANVPEVDIGKLKIANPVSITLDAFSNETFTAIVSHIDPAETVVDGVVNYKVTVVFDKHDERMKSGLTANLSVETFKKANVVILSEVAITTKDNGSFVQKLVAGKPVETRVEIGVRGQDGNVEIVSGLQEGDAVVSASTRK